MPITRINSSQTAASGQNSFSAPYRRADGEPLPFKEPPPLPLPPPLPFKNRRPLPLPPPLPFKERRPLPLPPPLPFAGRTLECAPCRRMPAALLPYFEV